MWREMVEDVGGIVEGRQGCKYMQTINFYYKVFLMVLKHLEREKVCCSSRFWHDILIVLNVVDGVNHIVFLILFSKSGGVFWKVLNHI